MFHTCGLSTSCLFFICYYLLLLLLGYAWGQSISFWRITAECMWNLWTTVLINITATVRTQWLSATPLSFHSLTACLSATFANFCCDSAQISAVFVVVAAACLFFPVLLLLNYRWSPPPRLHASHCSTLRILCDVPRIAFFRNKPVDCFLVGLPSVSLILVLLLRWFQLLPV